MSFTNYLAATWLLLLPSCLVSALDTEWGHQELFAFQQQLMQDELTKCSRIEDWSSEGLQQDDVQIDMYRAAACFARLVARTRPKGALVVELYAGAALLTKALARGLSEAGGSGHMLLSFEGDPKKMPRISQRLHPHWQTQLHAEPVSGLPGRVLRAVGKNRSFSAASSDTGSASVNFPPSVALVLLQGSAYPAEICENKCGRPMRTFWDGTDIHECFKCPLPKPGQSALRDLCESLLGKRGRLDLVVLDTASPGIEEWFVLEWYCRPRHILLVNDAFPVHQGWIVERLLQEPNSSWRDVHRGFVQWSWAPWPGMLELLRRTSFRLLADLSDNR